MNNTQPHLNKTSPTSQLFLAQLNLPINNKLFEKISHLSNNYLTSRRRKNYAPVAELGSLRLMGYVGGRCRQWQQLWRIIMANRATSDTCTRSLINKHKSLSNRWAHLSDVREMESTQRLPCLITGNIDTQQMPYVDITQ